MSKESKDEKFEKQLDKRKKERGWFSVPSLIHVQYNTTTTTVTKGNKTTTYVESEPAYGLDQHGQLWRYYPRQEFEDNQVIPAKWQKCTTRALDGTTHYEPWTPEVE